MSLKPGTRLGPYEVMAPVGAGGMGEVYRARDTRLNRTVALKVVNARWSDTEEGRQRFEREARVISRINHPNVCVLYDVGRTGDREFLVMEFVEGETLETRVERGPLSQDDAIRVGIALASGLDAAHREGVIHRDFKPANVILSKHGVKILDFGLARTLGDDPAESLAETRSVTTSMAGTVLGTLPYMAPEQLRGDPVDARADVFALGAVLYEMTAGRRAFVADSQAGIIAAVLEHHPPPSSSVRDGVSPLLDRLIAQCLAKDADARPQTAAEVARTLALIGDVTIPAPAATRRPRIWYERLAWVVLLAGAVLVAVSSISPESSPQRSQPLVRFDIPLPDGGSLVAVPDVGTTLAISPDGRHVAFPLTRESTLQLWLHSFETARTRPLRGTEDGLGPFWSPDSRHIAFFTRESLKRVSVEGEMVSDICAIRRGYAAGSWGADDTIVFTHFPGLWTRFTSSESVTGLMRVPARGGTPERLPVDVPAAALWPHLLPDKRHFLISTTAGIQRGALEGQTLDSVTDATSAAFYSPAGYLLYVRDGSLVADRFDPLEGKVAGEARVITTEVQYFAPTGGASVSVSNTGAIVYRRPDAAPRRLVWIERNGRELGEIAPDAPWVFAPRLSPDETHLVVSKQSPTSGATDMMVFELATGTPTQLTSDVSVDNWPTWSADGRSVVFSRDEGKPPRLFRKSLTLGTNPTPLMPARDQQGIQFTPDVARNGTVVFAEQGDIWLWRPGSAGVEPVVTTLFWDAEPAVSPTGRWLAYMSQASGRSEVYVQPFDRPGDSPQRVSDAGGSAPRWRADERELFFLDMQGRIMAIPMDPATGSKRGKPEPATTGTPPVAAFDVSRAGQRFVAVTAPPTRPAITGLLNWENLLK